MPLLASDPSRMPFRHAFARVGMGAGDAAQLHEAYRALLVQAGIEAVRHADGERQSGSYNLLVAREWMLLVPRSRDAFERASVNSLAYAGALFVREPHQLEAIRKAGPMSVLVEEWGWPLHLLNGTTPASERGPGFGGLRKCEPRGAPSFARRGCVLCRLLEQATAGTWRSRQIGVALGTHYPERERSSSAKSEWAQRRPRAGPTPRAPCAIATLAPDRRVDHHARLLKTTPLFHVHARDAGRFQPVRPVKRSSSAAAENASGRPGSQGLDPSSKAGLHTGNSSSAHRRLTSRPGQRPSP